MRCLVLIHVDRQSFETFSPPAELLTGMEKLMAEWSKKGIMLSTEGLTAPSKGKTLKLGGKKLTVTDGPYSEAKEVIGGFIMLQGETLEEITGHVRDFLQLHEKVLGPSFEIGCELRPLEG